MRQILAHSMLIVFVIATTQVSFAQQQADAVPSEANGSTTDGIGGLTTEGLGTNGADSDSGGFPGANSAQSFIGASGTEGFVGGARESMTNSAVNRFFREIAGGEVATGGTQDSSASPRRVPMSLRLGFQAPSPRAATALAGSGGVSLQRFLTAQPALSTVAASLDDAGTATLVGTVPDASTKRLAANLIRLQPGVRLIKNQIEVQTLAGHLE